MKLINRPRVGERCALNIRDVPVDLKAAFKAACARRRVTMRLVFVAIMRDLNADPEDQVVDFGKLTRTYRE